MRNGTDSVITRYHYDSRGRVTQVTDPRGHASYVVYQGSGFQNTDSTYGEAGASPVVVGVRRYYDAYGRLVATRDRNLVRDTTAYDLMNRVTYSAKQTRKVAYGYDALYLTSIAVNGRQTSYFPNKVGWDTLQTDVSNRYKRFEYDLNGNVTKWVYTGITSTYDVMNRPLVMTAGGATRTFFYDPQDRWSGVTRGSAIDTIKTDLAGRPSHAISVRGARVYTQQIGYDPGGQRQTHSLTYGAYSKTSRLEYDNRGRLKTLRDPSGLGGTVLGYNSDGLDTSRVGPGLNFVTGFSGVHAPSVLYYGHPSIDREYAYEPKFGFLSDRIRGDTALRYLYDGLGQLETLQRYVVNDPTNQCGRVVEGTGEMGDSCISKRVGLITTLTNFAYDSLGNRKNSNGNANVDLLNRQTWFNGRPYAYDASGNRTMTYAGDTAIYSSWNPEGELTKVTKWLYDPVLDESVLVDSVAFVYDGFGRRIKKVGMATGVHEYLLDGDNLLAELDSAGNVRTQYTYYPGVDRPHSVLVAATGQTYNILTEAPGSVTGLTTQQGDLVASWEYDVWGMPTTLTGGDSIPMTLRFAAREYDPETALYFNRARYYDPRQGRFISEDPIGLDGGLNPYTYAGNNPLNVTDPSGLKECAPSQIDAGWKNVRVNGVDECQAPQSQELAGIGVTAQRPGYWDAWWYNVQNRPYIQRGSGLQYVELAMPGWIGGPAGTIALGSKLEFLLGLAKGNAKNIARSREMASSLRSMGLGNTPATREYLATHLAGVASDPNNVLRVEANGRLVKESLLMGPAGAAKLQTIWDGPKLITINVFRGR